MPRAPHHDALGLTKGKKVLFCFSRSAFSLCLKKNPPACLLPGDVYKEEIRVDEEGIRAERAM